MLTLPERVLVVAAHPDDEVLGCGGTMARLASEGHAVGILILGEGATSRGATRADASNEDVRHLGACARRAAQAVSAELVGLGGLPDNRFDSVDLLDVTKIVEQYIAQWRPGALFAQHGGDLNLDHAITFRACMTAARPLPDADVSHLLAYEVPSSTEWAFQQFEPVFSPNVFIDISNHLETKLSACACYDTEMRAHPHPRSCKNITSAAHRWGAAAGVEAAEAFQIVRVVQS